MFEFNDRLKDSTFSPVIGPRKDLRRGRLPADAPAHGLLGTSPYLKQYPLGCDRINVFELYVTSVLLVNPN